MKTLNLLSQKTYPYCFRDWLNKVWQECRRLGIVNKNTSPVDTGLDPDGWLPYFMDGLSPVQAVQQDLNEQA